MPVVSHINVTQEYSHVAHEYSHVTQEHNHTKGNTLRQLKDLKTEIYMKKENLQVNYTIRTAYVFVVDENFKVLFLALEKGALTRKI